MDSDDGATVAAATACVVVDDVDGCCNDVRFLFLESSNFLRSSSHELQIHIRPCDRTQVSSSSSCIKSFFLSTISLLLLLLLLLLLFTTSLFLVGVDDVEIEDTSTGVGELDSDDDMFVVSVVNVWIYDI